MTSGIRAAVNMQRGFSSSSSVRFMSVVPSWATVNPYEPHMGEAQNLGKGKWQGAAATKSIIDPLTGKDMITVPDTKGAEIDYYGESLASCPKYGLHNPFYNVERYTHLGDVSFKMAMELRKPEVDKFFTSLIQRVTPKSVPQANGEVTTCRKWLEGFSGDQVRMLARHFGLPGDHFGQQTMGYRFPFGPTTCITPFNFPLEIPMIQAMSSVYMGNKCLVKVDEKVAIVMEQMVRLAQHCGLGMEDMDYLYCNGPDLNRLLVDYNPSMTMFTGSEAIANKLAVDLKGKIKLEDAGFDWKVLGPDVPADKTVQDYVLWQCDHDAYGFTGQKCSAQSILFVHENWLEVGAIDKLKALAAKRNLDDLTIGPVLSWTNDKIKGHIDNCLSIDGVEVAFGAKELENHTIPDTYGSYEPTALKADITSMNASQANFDTLTTELFGPFQVICTYNDATTDQMLDTLERISARLTAGVVSNDIQFCNKVLSKTTNGTTYVGIRARTTGAPQQHWFGPCGDPRAAGIHTPEAIKMVWSSHREIISDYGPIPGGWTTPHPK